MSKSSTPHPTLPKHPFPQLKPKVKIVESATKIDEIDFIELRWWFSVPQLGDHTWWASYDQETSELGSVKEMLAIGRAVIHNVDCVEIQINDWSRKKGWSIGNGFFYCRIDEENESEWVAVAWQNEDKKEFSSFLDKDFEQAWGGTHKRKLYDDGQYQLQADGSYKTTDGIGLGAGVYDVTIGEDTFSCLRVIDTDLSILEEENSSRPM